MLSQELFSLGVLKGGHELLGRERLIVAILRVGRDHAGLRRRDRIVVVLSDLGGRGPWLSGTVVRVVAAWARILVSSPSVLGAHSDGSSALAKRVVLAIVSWSWNTILLGGASLRAALLRHILDFRLYRLLSER